jgi:hypothetical protein
LSRRSTADTSSTAVGVRKGPLQPDVGARLIAVGIAFGRLTAATRCSSFPPRAPKKGDLLGGTLCSVSSSYRCSTRCARNAPLTSLAAWADDAAGVSCLGEARTAWQRTREEGLEWRCRKSRCRRPRQWSTLRSRYVTAGSVARPSPSVRFRATQPLRPPRHSVGRTARSWHPRHTGRCSVWHVPDRVPHPRGRRRPSRHASGRSRARPVHHFTIVPAQPAREHLRADREVTPSGRG